MDARVLVLIPAALGLWFAFTGNTLPLRLTVGAGAAVAAGSALGFVK